MSNPAPDRASRDRIRQAVTARRKHERSLTMAIERIANDYEEGRGATACMADVLMALGRNKAARPARPAVEITERMRKDLRTIEACGFAGAAQAGTTWRGPGGTVKDEDVPALTTPGLARRCYDWRAPRLLLSAAGRKAITKDVDQ